MAIRFPAPLQPGDSIAVCTPSSGVPEVLQGWLDVAPDAADSTQLNYADAVGRALAGLACPVLLDADIGHVPLQWSLLNGAWGELAAGNGWARLQQRQPLPV